MRREMSCSALFLAAFGVACGGGNITSKASAGTSASATGGSGANGGLATGGSVTASGGLPGANGGANAAGGAGTGGSATTGGSAVNGGAANGGTPNAAGGSPSGGAATAAGGAAVSASGGSTGPTMVTCPQAANPYAVSAVELDAGLVPHVVSQGFNTSLFAQVPVAVNATTGDVFVGFTRDVGGVLSAVIVPGTSGAGTPVVTIASAALGGFGVTNNGFGALIFDPNESVDDRTWAAVSRFDTSGQQLFTTDLFRSANLTDANTKGAPDTSRFAYIASADQLVAYFGHTEMIQGVRHQGGYLATVDAAGKQTLVSGWWGSHNLDQRLMVSGAQTALLGLGDAYPKGIFFAFLGNKPQTHVIYTLAGNGQGTTNGQLGGMVDLDDVVAVPFVTNDSISQTLTPGDWPNIDQTIADQISTAAANGNKLGLILVPKSGTLPSGDLVPVWLDASLPSGAHIERLKSARYGSGGLMLLAWAEVSGTGRNATRSYFTMIVDRTGAICQPKTALATGNAFTAGDDFVRRPDGSLVWANITSNRVAVVTLTPG